MSIALVRVWHADEYDSILYKLRDLRVLRGEYMFVDRGNAHSGNGR